MTRETITHGKYEISFGWDSPLDTFFAQVTDTADMETEEPLFWLGDVSGAYGDIESFTSDFDNKLLEHGVVDFSLSTAQIQSMVDARKASPPGAGMGRKTGEIKGFLKAFSSDFSS